MAVLEFINNKLSRTMDPLSDDLQENLDRLVVECLENGCIWGLQDQEGNWSLVSSMDNDSIDVIPFWSDQRMAHALCTGDWEVYKPVAIEMEEFLDDWLPGMHSDVLMTGINWNEDLEGQEMEPLDLLEEFEAELD
ncbi:DUF2750 domain-containing protein [Porticoccaceae bacterium]|nr:DUF2750 domain-containing protein [Porticoccaceae bacterium]MDC0133724.1 DUF2750 domain-containing protein [Porticoccaceae bacterium]MDC1477106.1 DUF2750 domain-containing protein [Porticoccaceae bacterium]